MYSYEIDKIMRESNYNIDSNTYINICRTSPQINRIKYIPFENKIEMWTEDNKYWKFNVYLKENNKVKSLKRQ